MLLSLAIVTVLQCINAGEATPPASRDPSFVATELNLSNDPQPRIKDYPWAVILESNHQAFCAGALISPSYVLTSDVCANRAKNSNTRVRSGSSFVGHGGSERKVAEVIIHEDYKKYYPHRSIGLVRVNESFEVDNSTRPIELIEVDELVEPSIEFGVPGWGKNSSNVMTERMRVVNMRIEYDAAKECTPGAYRICAVTLLEPSCHGDNGAPLVIDERLVGIQSYSSQPCRFGASEIGFVNVARYSDWIVLKSSSRRSSVAATAILTSIILSFSKLFC